MTAQDRNKNIEKCISTLKDLRYEFKKIAKPRMQYKRIRWALTCAIEALEKQIPKKPNMDRYDMESNSVIERCPVCFSMNIDVYCSKCGQLIDWE